MESYKVKGGVVEVADRGSGASGVVSAVGRGMAELSVYADDFRRSRLFLTREGIVYVPSPNESTVKNTLGAALSKGPINPLRLLGLYRPYAADLADANERDGAWAVSYADIDGLSLLSKSSGNELFVRSGATPSVLYRIRNFTGTDYVGVYRGNRKYAKRFAGEIYALAGADGGVTEFDAGPEFSVYTKQREIPEDRRIAREDLPTAPPGTVGDATEPSGTPPRSERDTTTADPPGTASPADERGVTDSHDGVGGVTGQFRVRNGTDSPTRLTVGCRTDGDVVFTDRVTLDSGEETAWNDLPEERFQIGMSGAVEAAETFRPTDLDGALVAAVTEAGVSFGVEDGMPRSGEATAAPTPSPESHGTGGREERSPGRGAGTDREREPGANRGPETDVGDASAGGAVDERDDGGSDGLKLRLLGFGVVAMFLVLPASGIALGPGPVTFAVFLVGSVLILAGLVQAVRSWLG
jgi:hypothetical protein